MLGPFTLVGLVDKPGNKWEAQPYVRLIAYAMADHRRMSELSQGQQSRPRLAEPPQLICTVDNTNKWLLF